MQGFRLDWINTVTLFNFLKLIQNLLVPSFFLTSTIGDAYGELDGSMMRIFIMSSTSAFTVSLRANGSAYGLLQIGSGVLKVISC